MSEYLMHVAADWHGAETRSALRVLPDALERRTSRRPRRSEDRAGGSTIEAGDPFVARAALATLEKFNRGILLLDASGTVLQVNRAASGILRRRDGITVRHRHLSVANAEAASALADYLKRGEGSLVLRIDGPSPGRQGYRMLVSPLGPGGADAGYCVFIYEPHRGRQALPTQLLQELYGLTSAESRLANALFTGRSLQQAAIATGVSINTAKTTLKRIFAKCEVGTQAELMLLLSLGPRTL